MMERMTGLGFNHLTWQCFLFLGILITVTACLPPQEQNTSVSERTDVGDGSNLLQWRKDTSEARRHCFQPAERQKLEIADQIFRCTKYQAFRTIIQSSWPNLTASVFGQCYFPRKPQIAGVCQIENGEVRSMVLYKGDYLHAAKKCLQGLWQYRLSDKPWAHDRSLVFDYGFEERNLSEDHEYILSGIIKWKIYDPVKSKLEKPPLYYVVGEEKERFQCRVKNGVVQGYTFAEVGPLTWEERGKMEEFKFYQ